MDDVTLASASNTPAKLVLRNDRDLAAQRGSHGDSQGRSAVLLVIAAVLFVVWLVSFAAFHMVGGQVHLILAVSGVLFMLGLFWRGPA